MDDKHVLLWVYSDGESPPLIIVNPPGNLADLLAEWNLLDRVGLDGQGNPFEVCVSDWLEEKGVEILLANSEIYLDDYQEAKS